jgi:hypothetical protein
MHELGGSLLARREKENSEESAWVTVA